MPVIRICEQQQLDGEFRARLSVADRDYADIVVDDRFFDIKEAELEWYFEQWLQFPMLNKVKAEEVAATIKSYGQQLFEQVFSDRDAYADYKELRNNLETLRFEIVGDNPDFQALHWEALRDPALPRPLAVDCVMVRRSRQAAAKMPAMQSSPTINLLLVTARPYQNDVAYRTISRPLIEAIANSQLPVKIDLLRPATFESLARHLKAEGQGHYHIIHFDCHGALLNYRQFNPPKDEKSKSASNPLTFKRQERYGRGEIAPYEGVKAFLVLEGDGDGEEDLVEATEMAALLTGQNIPVCILNACQSGKQLGAEASFVLGQDEDYRETSLGSRLMAAGMQMVVAMGYSVTVTAAEVMMQQVYRQLFARQPMEKAVQLGRWELFQQKGRRASFNQTIPLEDWLLPVVYGSQQVNLNLREFSPQEEELYFEAQDREFRFVQPEYEFVGRDLDILRIEKALHRHNMLLLQGMGGTGKTTLLNFLREWWEKTHFGQQIFYFGYDERAWTLEQILFALGQGVYDRFELGRFQAMSLAAQSSKLVALLRGVEHILILDNLESVTGEPLAIPNTLPPEERGKLRDFLGRLAGGKTRVIFGSRCAEDWLKSVTFQQNIYGLRGLDPEARTQLAQKILQFHVPKRVQEIEADPEFTRLMKVLAGYPLALEVVLPNLKSQSPSQILTALQSADFEDVDSEDKTKSILKCVEYSHSNLSPDAQKLLICLAPFSGFLDRDAIPVYAEELQKLAPFTDYDFAGFDGAIQEAINWGLLEGMDEENRLLTIQPIFPYFLKTKAATLNKATRQALQEGFKNHYQNLADSYNQLMESKDAQERQLGILFCRLEYENLYNALQICLANQESMAVFTLWGVLDEYLKLITDASQKLKLAKYVYAELKAYPVSLKSLELNLSILGLADTLAVSYFELKDYSEAKRVYLDNLETIQALTAIPEQSKQSLIASTYHQLGAVTQKMREYAEARSYYQQSLQIFIEYSDRYEQAGTYHQLGRVAEELQEYGEARSYYQQALQIYIEYGDRYSQASTYHCLGSVAEDLEDFPEAKNNFLQALLLWHEFKDEYSIQTFSVPAFSRLYQATQDETLLESMAQILGITPEEAQQLIS